MKEKWNQLRARDCRDDFQADNIANFFRVNVVLLITDRIRDFQDCLKKSSAAQRWWHCALRPVVVLMKRYRTLN